MIATSGLFWLSLTVVFSVMGINTYRIKHTLMPKWFKESHEREYWAGADIEKIRPLFDHMLLMEIVAYVLTALSAFVEFWNCHC